MTANNTTSNVSVTRDENSGVGGTDWTVDVTNANLSPDITVKDFRVLFAGVSQNLANFTKTSPTVITYTGLPLLTATTVIVQRNTPITRVSELAYRSKVNAVDWEGEFNRLHRILNEYDLNGVGSTVIPTFGSPVNDAYVYAVWSTDTVQVPTRQAVANKLNSMDTATALLDSLKAPKANPTFTGILTAPSIDGDAAVIDTVGTGTLTVSSSSALAAATATSMAVTNALSGGSLTVTGTSTLAAVTATAPAMNADSTRVPTIAMLNDRFLLHAIRFTATSNLVNNVSTDFTYGTTIGHESLPASTAYSDANMTFTAPWTGIYRISGYFYIFQSVAPTALSHIVCDIYTVAGAHVGEFVRAQFAGVNATDQVGEGSSFLVLTGGVQYRMKYFLGNAAGNYTCNGLRFSVEFLSPT